MKRGTLQCFKNKKMYEKTIVAQNKSNLLLKNQMYNMSTLQLVQLKWFN
jgi:hypothetical protein